MALVKYNAKNVYTVGVLNPTAKEKGAEHATVPLRFLPGVNEVDDSLLKQATKNPHFQYRITHGIIEILENFNSTEKKRGRPKKTSLKSKDEKLLKIVDQVYDVRLLKKYIKEAESNELKERAQTQLDKINAQGVEETNGDSDKQ